MNCLVLAEALIDASLELKIALPLIVRLEGNMSEQAKELLRKAKLKIQVADDLNIAAKLAVEAL